MSLVLLLAACSTKADPPPPALPADERPSAEAYLEAVGALNRDARGEQAELQWWVSRLPGVVWEERGNLPYNLNDVRMLGARFADFDERAGAIHAVPESAAEAHAAYLAALRATREMLAVHQDVIELALSARANGQSQPARPATEARLRAARDAADRATIRAQHELNVLLQRYSATV